MISPGMRKDIGGHPLLSSMSSDVPRQAAAAWVMFWPSTELAVALRILKCLTLSSLSGTEPTIDPIYDKHGKGGAA